MTIKQAKLKALKTEILCSALRAQDDDYPVSYMLLELKRLLKKDGKELTFKY